MLIGIRKPPGGEGAVERWCHVYRILLREVVATRKEKVEKMQERE